MYEDTATFKERAVFSDAYRFFNLDFSIRSDSRSVLEVFKAIFRHFLRSDNAPGGLSYYVVTADGFSGMSAVIADDRVYTVEEPYDLIGYAYMKIMNSALSKVASHYLLHAASLSFNGMGLILPAASGSGKTTLTVELLKRGFDFLSDDVTAISRTDCLIHPFPKGIGILPSTMELCPETELESLKHLPLIGGGVKGLIDIGDIYPERTGGPCRARYLIFLGSRPEMQIRAGDRQYLYVVVSRINEALLSDLKRIEGVKDVTIHALKKYPVLRFLFEGKMPFLSLIEDTCGRHRVLVFESSDGNEEKMDFSGAPRLEKVPKSTASIELLSRLKGLSHAGTLQGGNGVRGTDLLMFFGRFLKGVECLYLSPGRLKERADRICELYIRGDT